MAILATFAANGALTLDYNGHRFLNGKFPGAVAVKTVGDTGWKTPTFDAATKTYTFNWTSIKITAQCIVEAQRLTYLVQCQNISAANIMGLWFNISNLTPPTVTSTVSGGLTSIKPPLAVYNWNGGNMSWCCGNDPRSEFMAWMKTSLPAQGWLQTYQSEKQDNRAFSNPIAPATSSPVYTLSLRFDEDVDDIRRRYRDAFPYQQLWTDNRAIMRWIGTNPGTPTNPNGWEFNAGQGLKTDWDVTTPEGLAVFRSAALYDANLRLGRMNQIGQRGAQGVIFWQLEGNRKPGFAYIGDPRVTYSTAPEWLYETGGKRLIDEFLGVFKGAGKHIGVCLRRGTITYDPATDSMVADRTTVPEAQDYIDKITWAKAEWGCNLFYIDSIDVRDSGRVMAEVNAAHPDVLLLPEHSGIRAFGSASAHRTGAGGFKKLDTATRKTWPWAFQFYSITSVNDSANIAADIDAVRSGDGVLFGAHYESEPGYVAAKAIYPQAGY